MEETKDNKPEASRNTGNEDNEIANMDRIDYEAMLEELEYR